MSSPRKTSTVPDFPFLHPQVCWVLVTDDGQVLNPSSRTSRLDAASMVQQGKARLFIAWPGRSRSDLFEVDDAEQVIGRIIAMLSREAGR